MEKIYRVHNFGLGDAIGTLNYLNFRARLTGERLTLSTISHGVDMSERLRDLVYLMAYRKPTLTLQPPNTQIDGYRIWSAPPFDTPEVFSWSPTKTVRQVAYQFDGESSAEDKNPSETEVAQILAHITGLGFTPVRLGKEQTLIDAAEILSNSALFVGCTSGFSHLAHVTRTPCYIYERNLPIITYHRQKQFVKFHSVQDFIHQSRMFFELFEEGIV